ncbi:hypothetical protein [Rhodoferax fermentans]|uniref:hypothetical protein n=1 Tax=Rhodoferax fermentans TaxID=28066 RepID=UPI001301F316|nr:hypothetical protein [Rhodoferax fermentans]
MKDSLVDIQSTSSAQPKVLEPRAAWLWWSNNTDDDEHYKLDDEDHNEAGFCYDVNKPVFVEKHSVLLI